MARTESEPGTHFPRRYTLLFVLVGGSLAVGGFALWWPARDGASTAQSDLGLALIGGGLALAAGFLVSRVIFNAERRFDAALQASGARHERETLKMTLSMTPNLKGVDLHGRDLAGLRLDTTILYRADLSGANLRGANLTNVNLQQARLSGADLRDLRGQELHFTDGKLDAVDLRGAAFAGECWGVDLRAADLRGADLSRVEFARAPGEHEAQLSGARYDRATQWPDGFDPVAAGARFVADG